MVKHDDLDINIAFHDAPSNDSNVEKQQYKTTPSVPNGHGYTLPALNHSHVPPTIECVMIFSNNSGNGNQSSEAQSVSTIEREVVDCSLDRLRQFCSKQFDNFSMKNNIASNDGYFMFQIDNEQDRKNLSCPVLSSDQMANIMVNCDDCGENVVYFMVFEQVSFLNCARMDKHSKE